jgi:hypothetical protein
MKHSRARVTLRLALTLLAYTGAQRDFGAGTKFHQPAITTDRELRQGYRAGL